MSDVETTARGLAESCVHMASQLLAMTTRSKDLYEAMYEAHKLQKLCNDFISDAAELMDIDMEGYFE